MNDIESMLGSLVENYPWVAFILIWLLWVAGTLWEHQGHRNKQITGAWLLFLFCVLAYAVSTVEALGFTRWLLTAGVLAIGWLSLNRVLRNDPDNKENAV